MVLDGLELVETQSGNGFNGVTPGRHHGPKFGGQHSILQYFTTGEARRITVQDTRIETP